MRPHYARGPGMLDIKVSFPPSYICQPPPRRTRMRVRIAYACREALYIAPPPLCMCQPPPLYKCVCGTIYVSAYCCIWRARICGVHYCMRGSYVSACVRMCVCIYWYLLYVCPHTAIYVGLVYVRFTTVCGVLMCAYVSAYCYLLSMGLIFVSVY